ncbi:MAG: MFS transporter [Acidimicrobiia bacterium]
MAIPRSILSRELLPASIAIYTAVAIVAFEGLAVTAALPDLTADLGGVRLLPWVITAFLLASGVMTAIAGSFVDSLGTSTVFRWGTIGFALASLGAAAATSMPLLVAARVLQGASGGAIISVGIAAVALVYPSHLMGRAFAANSNVWGVLGFASPAIAAGLLEVGSWRWIFLLMVPICLVALIAGWRTLPGPVEPARLEIDWVAVGLLVATVGAFLGALSNLTASSWALGGGALIGGSLLWRRMSGGRSNLLDRRFIGDYPYRQLALAASLTLVAMLGLSAYLPVYVRGARGASAAAAAWSVLWLTIGWTVAANIAGRVTDRVSERSVLRVGALAGIPAIGAAWAAVSFSAPLPVVYATYFAMGLSVGAVTNSALQMVRLAVPDNLAGRATSAHAFLRTLGLSVGAGLAGGVILATVAASVDDVASVRAALAGEVTELAGGAVTALGRGFALAHGVSLAIMVVALLAARRLMAGPAPGGEPGERVE